MHRGRGDEQPHAHVMLTTRHVGAEGFGAKERHWDQRTMLTGWRERWAVEVNAKLAEHGHAARVDHRSHADRGITLEPQIHIGAASLRRQEQGRPADRVDQHREIVERNAIRDDLREQGLDLVVPPGQTARQVIAEIHAATKAAEAERGQDRERDTGQYLGR